METDAGLEGDDFDSSLRGGARSTLPVRTAWQGMRIT
jgi:hypothetical protein